MNWFGWALLMAIVVWPLCWLLQPWRWATFTALVTHPPLGPYTPPWWWAARLMRFGYLAWRLIVFVQALFLSAIVAVGVNAESSSRDVQAWYDSGWRLAFQLMAFLWFGLAFDLAFNVWRITNQKEWRFRRRSLADLYLPAVLLGVVLWVTWSVAMGVNSS